MGISNIPVLYDEERYYHVTGSLFPADEWHNTNEVIAMPTKSNTPEPPNEPDIFDEDKFEVDENEAEFDVEETNKKEDASK